MKVVPLLPCASIDDMLTFYTALGFEQTYRQTKPNPYLAMQRAGTLPQSRRPATR